MPQGGLGVSRSGWCLPIDKVYLGHSAPSAHGRIYKGPRLLSTMSFSNDKVIVSTMNYVPGYDVQQVLGVAVGITVRSRGIGGRFLAGLRSVVGGEISEFVENAEKARKTAMERMISHAATMGANAVLQVYFDSNELSEFMDEIIAYGTAVRLTPRA